MKIAFQRIQDVALPELLFCWRLEIATASSVSLTDIFIPELFYDLFWIDTGEIDCVDQARRQEFALPRQTLKTLHTHRLDLVLQAPLILYGARFSLPFAELYWQKELPANTFLPQNWLHQPATDLASFTHQIIETIQTRRVKRTIAPMLLPTLEETAWLAAYSPRHKRRLYKSVFGLSRKELLAIQNIHLFLGQTCDFTAQRPRIVEYVNADSFYDQPHLNNAFKKMTGLTPLAYFEATSTLQDNLMAASYNALPDNSARI